MPKEIKDQDILAKTSKTRSAMFVLYVIAVALLLLKAVLIIVELIIDIVNKADTTTIVLTVVLGLTSILPFLITMICVLKKAIRISKGEEKVRLLKDANSILILSAVFFPFTFLTFIGGAIAIGTTARSASAFLVFPIIETLIWLSLTCIYLTLIILCKKILKYKVKKLKVINARIVEDDRVLTEEEKEHKKLKQELLKLKNEQMKKEIEKLKKSK